MRTRLSCTSFARDLRRGVFTFKSFGNSSFLDCSLLESSALAKNEGLAAGRRFRSSPGPCDLSLLVTSPFLHVSFVHSLAYISNEGDKWSCSRPGMCLGRKNLNLEETVGGEGWRKKVTVDYRSYRRLKERQITGEHRLLPLQST